MNPNPDALAEAQRLNDLEPFLMTLSKFGKTKLALECLDVFAEQATTFWQWDNVSKCYFKLKDYDKSIKYGEIALVTAPNPQIAYLTRQNLTNVYNHNNQPEKALLYVETNQRLANTPDLELEKSYSLFLLNRKKEAQVILETVLATVKDLPEETKTKIRFNLGTYFLYEDKFQQGMRHFLLDGAKMKLWNTETIFHRNKKLDLTFWEGTPDVKNLIVYAEAGIGDEIINVRFMKHLQQRGINAIWYESIIELERINDKRPGLVELFRKNNIPVVETLDEVKKIPGVMWTYSMRLPIYLNLEYKDLWDGPYLQPCPVFKEKWKLGGSKPKIGLRWKGSPLYDQDLHRSYPLKQLHETIGHLEADFYSLQRDEGVEDTKDFPGLIDLSDKLNSIEDTFALISNLDVVVTSCTSIAHMAASQGKQVIILVPISAYYTWSHSGDKSPWYGDHVTLLRQQKPRVWDDPMSKLEAAIKSIIKV
jgi:tetratricopeptide (TPR) repeat protein